MSWQLGAFAILALALATGFGWYELSRPDARIVALVATLAAFAALGRIAFAALPNVKPTTDIVLISGYALGAGPGFVVGALAGLTSNFFFGQGPWTPWQMAAWGGAGLVGAGAAMLTRRRLGRLPLAVLCGAVGFAFTALQDVGDWVTYSDHSLAQLGVYVGKGIGFDVIHAIGCVAFALAFGPAFARSIGRFSMRLQVRWEAVAPLVIGAVVVAGAVVGPPAHAANSPTSYLLGAQNGDGGFGTGPGQASVDLYSGWAALGLAANGVDPQRVVKDGHSLVGYIRATSATDTGAVERTILALKAAGQSTGALVGELERRIRRNGSVSGQTNLTAFAVLALRAALITPPAKTTGWLARQQDRDGGFNYATAPGTSDIDDTGAALEALGSSSHATARAVRFLERHQNRDGGFPSQPGAASNAQSTAWAVQGLLAAGAASASVDRALSYLRSLEAPDGHIRYSRSSDQTPVWVTAEALMALARKPLPIAPVVHKIAPVKRAARKAAPRPRAVVARRPPKARPVRRHSPSTAKPSELTFATDAGFAAAVLLAPIGLG
jgi:energy-coupling factor transport system substrate-specific component